MKHMAFFLILIAGISHNVFAEQSGKTLRLTLEDALTRAAKLSVDVLVAQDRVVQALGRIEQSRSTLLPQVTGTVAGARQTRDLRSSGMTLPSVGTKLGPFNTFDARGRITLDIFDPAAIMRLKSAHAGKQLVEEELFKAKEDALAFTAVLYIEAQRARQQMQMARVMLKRDKRIYEITQAQLQQGTASRQDYHKAKSALSQSQYMYKRLIKEADSRRMDMAAALQIPLETNIIFDEKKYPDVLDVKVDGVYPTEVRLAQAQVNVQNNQLKGHQAELLPKVTLAGDYGRNGETPDNASNTYSVGLQATIPVWEGGRTQGQIKESQAKLQEAHNKLKDAEMKSSVRVLDARKDIDDMQMLVESAQIAVDAADEDVRIALVQLNTGAGQEIEVHTASARQAKALDDRREAVAGYWTARINYLHALGQMRTLIE